MTRRSLALRRETLTELAASDLTAVVGAAIPTVLAVCGIPATKVCITRGDTCVNC